jgi:hypothetical protein
MVAILFAIEGAEVLSFVEDDESGRGVFGILIEMPLVETSCPICGSTVVGVDPIKVELPSTRAGRALVPVAWRRRQWRCPEPGCPQDLFDEENEQVDHFIARVAPRRRSEKLPILSGE